MVGDTTINAAEVSVRFFSLQKVQDAIGDSMEVTIQVVHVPRTASESDGGSQDGGCSSSRQPAARGCECIILSDPGPDTATEMPVHR